MASSQGQGQGADTRESIVRGEFAALGPGAWNASETLACDDPNLSMRAKHLSGEVTALPAFDHSLVLDATTLPARGFEIDVPGGQML